MSWFQAAYFEKLFGDQVDVWSAGGGVCLGNIRSLEYSRLFEGGGGGGTPNPIRLPFVIVHSLRSIEP